MMVVPSAVRAVLQVAWMNASFARASVVPKRVVAVGLSLAGLFAGGDAWSQSDDFEVVARGPTIQATVGMSRAGYRLMGALGGASTGIRSFAGGRWLLSWD